MPAFVCVTCGTQYPDSETPPEGCRICQEERQFIPVSGQAWTTLDTLRQRHRNSYRHYEPALLGVGTVPDFAIAQRALLVSTPKGNVLWDCVAFLDDATVRLIAALGGITAIAISHPHFYTTMIEWSHAFGRVPIYLHANDREWVVRPDPVIEFWSGDRLHLMADLTLVNVGGHFEGGTAMHWASGADGRGVLLGSDMVHVTQDHRWLSFMRSYPNYIPLSPRAVRQIVDRLEPFSFDRVYGIWWDAVMPVGGKAALIRSAARYIAAVSG
jgi:hypothetical protein